MNSRSPFGNYKLRYMTEHIRVNLSSAQTIENNAAETILWTTTTEKIGNIKYYTATGRIEVKIPGIYLFQACIDWGTNSTGVRQITFKDPSEHHCKAKQEATSSGSAYTVISMVREMAINETYQVTAYQNSGGDLTVDSSNACYFTATRIGQ